jgi:hypothetical protein
MNENKDILDRPKKQPSLVPGCGGTETPMHVRGRRILWCWDQNRTGIFPGDHVYLDLDTDHPLTEEEVRPILGY